MTQQTNNNDDAACDAGTLVFLRTARRNIQRAKVLQSNDRLRWEKLAEVNEALDAMIRRLEMQT